jgi:small subunit ribosomal protein S6
VGTDRGEKGWLATMPLYDFVVMVKPAVDRRNLVEFMTRVGQRVYARSGVVTNIKSFGRVNLAYDIKKRDGRFSEAHMMQMTFMVNPQFHQELSYLNKDERLLRWMMIRSRGNAWTKIGKD